MGKKKEKRKNIRVQMRSPGNVKIKIVQFWKLQKKKYKTCNKNKSYKNPSIFKNSKNRKISRGRKKKNLSSNEKSKYILESQLPPRNKKTRTK